MSRPNPFDPANAPQPPVRDELLAGQRPPIEAGKVLVTAGDGFDGYELISYQGICWGMSGRSLDVGQDCMKVCKGITGGELDSYAQLGDEARQRALHKMFSAAKRQRANAVINFRFEFTPSQGGTGSVVAHGTGVVIKPIPDYLPLGASGALLRDIADSLKRQ